VKLRTTFVTLVVGVGLLHGCGAAHPVKFYQLTVPANAATPAATGSPYPVTILLGSIMTAHLYRDDHIVYSAGGEAMGTYEYQRWAQPPAEMIHDVLLQQLRASARYQHVYSLRSDSRGDYVLRGHLFDFREVGGNGLAARVAFDFELRDSKTGATVWSHTYTHDEPVSGKDVSGVVSALNHNMQSGLTETLGSLEQFFATVNFSPASSHQ
jgi:ABC-type uncharacterized transport system auxiliary subunit